MAYEIIPIRYITGYDNPLCTANSEGFGQCSYRNILRQLGGIGSVSLDSLPKSAGFSNGKLSTPVD